MARRRCHCHRRRHCHRKRHHRHRRRLIRRLARIVRATPAIVNGALVLQAVRSDLKPRILRRRTRSPLVLPVFFSLERRRGSRRTLNLGEAVLRQREVNRVMRVLRRKGILVTALHNHWLFEKPRLMYMHWEAVMRPVRFLRASRRALKAAGVRFRPL
ncbi:MAG: DUF1259 domain-containing protein [Thermaerobacter sp.]|nr:hypothetical protein [Bacillota bacterium]